MATIEQLEQALVNADQAGDTEAATRLAVAVKRARETPSKPTTVGDLLAEKARTTPGGLMGAVTRGFALPAAGAAAGAVMGAPIAGVGAVPGALAGAGAAALTQLVGDPVISMVNKELGTHYTLPSDALEHWLTKVGVPEARTTAERIAQQMASGAAGAGGMAAAGGAMAANAAKPVVQGVGRQLAAQPAAQVAGGASAGAAGQAMAETGAPPPLQVAASLAGGVAGARAARPRAAPVSPSPPPQAIADAERTGVRVMTSDVLPPKTFASRWLQSTGEKIPLAGTGPARATQQMQRVQAVRDLLDEYGVGVATHASDDVMRDLATKRTVDLMRYTDQKRKIINGLSRSGNVDVTKTLLAIDRQIGWLGTLRTKEVGPAIARLKDWRTAINHQTLPNVEMLRKQLGESFTAPELVTIRSTSQKVLSSIYGALRADMEAFISANGARRDVAKWKVANARLSQMADDLEMPALKSVLKRGEATPEVVDRLLFSKRPSDAQKLYRELTPTGRATARAAILSRAAEKAHSIDPGGIDTISPDKFIAAMKRLGPSVGVFFARDDLSRVEGLVRAIQVTKRAGQAAAAPPTGVQVAIPVGAAILTDMLGGAGAATATGAAIGGLARLYESAPVRDLLLRIARTPRGSAEEAALAKRLIAAVQTQESRSLEPRPE